MHYAMHCNARLRYETEWREHIWDEQVLKDRAAARGLHLTDETDSNSHAHAHDQNHNHAPAELEEIQSPISPLLRQIQSPLLRKLASNLPFDLPFNLPLSSPSAAPDPISKGYAPLVEDLDLPRSPSEPRSPSKSPSKSLSRSAGEMSPRVGRKEGLATQGRARRLQRAREEAPYVMHVHAPLLLLHYCTMYCRPSRRPVISCNAPCHASLQDLKCTM